MEVDCKIPVSVVLPDPTNSTEIKDDFEARPIEYYTFYGTDTQQMFYLDIWPEECREFYDADTQQVFDPDKWLEVLGVKDGDR